jgi:predicted TPR repeat methyltransferase
VFAADTDANRTLYDEYASKYDKIQNVTGFNDPAMIVKYMVDNNFSKDTRIIDFGCSCCLS